jgi:hypothetical protein
MEEGFVDYLVKPVEGKCPQAAVKKVMEQREMTW